MKRVRPLVCLAATMGWLLSGCGGDCDDILFSGVEITVLERASSYHICGADLLVRKDGEELPGRFTVDSTDTATCVHRGTFSSAGAISVTISHSAYVNDSIDDIEIQQLRGCDDEPPPPIVREVELRPAPHRPP